MNRTRERAAQIEQHDYRDAFIAVVEQIAPQLSGQLQTVLTYVFVSAFWALVAYMALAYALQ